MIFQSDLILLVKIVSLQCYDRCINEWWIYLHKNAKCRPYRESKNAGKCIQKKRSAQARYASHAMAMKPSLESLKSPKMKRDSKVSF